MTRSDKQRLLLELNAKRLKNKSNRLTKLAGELEQPELARIASDLHRVAEDLEASSRKL